MADFFHWLFSASDPFYISSGLHAVGHADHSPPLLFWILVYTVVRYQVPDFALWIAHTVRPHVFDPPPLRKYAGAQPLVSFLIAGRNPGQSIVACIRSVLESDYRNVEVIFADDKSTDNSVALARTFERTGRVRVFANANHSGKAANLNAALMFARGEFLFVLDSDTQILPDTITRMLPYFEDPRVGAVAAGIWVRNNTASLLTRFQRIEYMLTYTLAQLWRSELSLIALIPGMGGMFRTAAVRGLGGFDMGLGDDTDMTLRLRKARWRLKMSLTARISTDVPVTLWHLLRQRSRWTRNMVKMRLRKHRDMGTFRYGFTNAVVFYENLLNRTIHPLAIVGLALYAQLYLQSTRPLLLGSLYLLTTLMLFAKVIIARDLAGEPSLRVFWLIPFYLLYRVPLLLTQVTQILREVLHIKTWHPYVPRRIWDQIPHH